MDRKRHICIDFEGEGKRRDGGVPPPALLGALVPSLAGYGASYHLWLLLPELAPMARSRTLTGSPDNRRVGGLRDAIEEVVGLADERGCRLVAYSVHESAMVAQHLPGDDPARERFLDCCFNIKPKANALRKRYGLEARDAGLDELVRALMPRHRFPPPPKCGVAEACRRLRKAGAASKRWRRWSPVHQQLARELVSYNRGDCRAVWRLVNRVIANYDLPDLR